MNSRKEMIPVPVREMHKSGAFCKPEWDLLCRIRAMIKSILNRPLKGSRMSKGEGIVREQLRIIISRMNVTFDDFDDWPEDPK